MLFSISYKHLQDSNPEGKKCLKPLSSVLNANVFVYDGFNTELKINDFQQLHSRPINRSEYYKIHTEEEQLDNLQHQYLSRKSWKYRTCFLLFSECTLLQKLKTKRIYLDNRIYSPWHIAPLKYRILNSTHFKEHLQKR